MEHKVEGIGPKTGDGRPRTENGKRRVDKACAWRKPILIVMAVCATAGQAQFDRSGVLINVPTANVLSRGSLAGSFGLTVPLTDPPRSHNYPTEVGAAVRFAPIDRLEVGLTVYTLTDYVLGATYRLLGEPGKAGLAVGIHDIGIRNYVSPVGNGLEDAWPDWKYPERQMENLSAFAVTSIPVTEYARFHLGIGRGRYVGYDRGKYINTDIFLDERHQWATGLMGGFEVDIWDHVTFAFDIDGRDVNAGIKLDFAPVSATVAVTKLEGFTPEDYADRFGRIAFSVGYQLDNLYRPKPAKPVPKPVPVPEPEPVVVEPEYFYLEPVYFGLDKSDIRTPAAEVLKRNADAILAKDEAGEEPEVVIEGHCCPLATSEYNMALGMRRARAARDFLVELGVDPDVLETVSYGEERTVTQDTSKYYLNRRCEFRMQEEER